MAVVGAVFFVLSLAVMLVALVRMEVRMYSSRRELERVARELRATSGARGSGERPRSGDAHSATPDPHPVGASR